MAYSLTAIAFVTALLAVAMVLGSGLLARLGAWRDEPIDPIFFLLATALGMGCSAVALIILASVGQLRILPILVGFGSMFCLSAWWLSQHAPAWPAALGSLLGAVPGRAARHPVAASLWIILGLLGLLLAMRAPLEWDELAYHLPYARDYAAAGGLVVSDYLRFPLQPHNFQLFYSVALLFSTEAAAHLLHAASGALVLAGVYAYARERFGRGQAVLASLMCLYAFRNLVDTAYIDLALTMFVFYAFVAFALWQRSRHGGLLLVAAFLLAMAAGTKYHGLLQLAPLALALLLATRSPGPWMRTASVLLLFGTFWYLRNWIISGDPVHPFGAPLFGFTLWDAADLEGQYRDIGRYGHHLPLELLPALALAFLPGRRRPEEITLLVLGFGGLLLWYLTSRYDRYMLPTYPFLAILSAQVIVQAWQRLRRARAHRAGGERHRRWAPVGQYFAVALIALGAAVTIHRQWDETCFTRACVDRVWARELPAQRVVNAVPGFGRLRLYQFGLEDQVFILGPNTVGDWYGPYRYRDVKLAMEEAGSLATKLRSLGRDSIMVNRARPWFDEFPPAAALQLQFETLYEDAEVALYRIADHP